MTPKRRLTVRSYEWWQPARKRFAAGDATPFEPDLIFPVAWLRPRPWTKPPRKRSDR